MVGISKTVAAGTAGGMQEPDSRDAAALAANDWGSQKHVQVVVLTVATACGMYLCYQLAAPFFPAIVWTLALAVVFTPFQRWVESKVVHPNLAAGISVLMIGVVLLGLATFVGERLVREAANGAQLITTNVESGKWRHALEAHPSLAPFFDWMERQDLPGTVKPVAAWMTTTGASFIKGSVIEVLELLLTFYLLFYFLRDRRTALHLLRTLSPLSDIQMTRLFDRVGDTIYATIYGTLTVSALQGLLGGLMFWWLGLPTPLLWGVVMGLLAVAPMLGASVVWGPAALLMGLEGSWGKALTLTLWGMIVVGTIDNLLRPILAGNRLRLHTVFAFISVVGGLILFGPAGLILGPVVLTVTIALLEVWSSRTIDGTVVDVEPEELSSFENEGGAGSEGHNS